MSTRPPFEPRRLASARPILQVFFLLSLLATVSCQHRGGPQGEGPATSAQSPQPGGILTVSIPSDVITLNPILPRNGPQTDFWPFFYPSLVTLDPRDARPAAVRGDLARRWDWAEDSETLTLTIHRDRFWQDTLRVRMADVLESYEAYRTAGWIPAKASEDSLSDSGLLAVEAVDDSTVRMRFRAGIPLWRAWPAATWPIVPAMKLGTGKTVELETSPLGREPLSAGPFRLVEWRPGLNLWLGRNPLAPPDREPLLRGVAFEPCPGVDTRILRVAFGEADVDLDVPVFRLPELLAGAGISGKAERIRRRGRIRATAAGADSLQLHREGTASVEMLFWSLSAGMAQPAVREAASLAVDRSAIVDRLLTYRGRRFGGPAGGLLEPDGRIGADSLLAQAPLPRYDPGAADTLLDQAGWTERTEDGFRARAGLPLRIEMLYDRNDEFRERLALLLEEDLARVGIECDATPLDGRTLWRRFRSGVFETALLGFRPPVEPDESVLWASWGYWNGGGYASVRTDSLIRAEESTSREEDIERLVREIEAQIRRDRPVTFLVRREGVDLLSPRVRDFSGSAGDPFGDLTRTWLADTTMVAPSAAPEGGAPPEQKNAPPPPRNAERIPLRAPKPVKNRGTGGAAPAAPLKRERTRPR